MRTRATGPGELHAYGALADLATALLRDVIRQLDSATERCLRSCRPTAECADHADTLHAARGLCARAGLVLVRYRRAVRAYGGRRRDG